MVNQSLNKIRIVTAASLFDGHDAAINIMRRILQQKGAEIIHLGHNRSVAEIVECAIEEDVHGIAITSYQGGHVEFFKYMKDLLDQNGCGHIKIFGGGGGTILPKEIEILHQYGITRIYSPDDGRKMGLEGMIEDLLNHCNQDLITLPVSNIPLQLNKTKDIRKIAREITLCELGIRNEELGTLYELGMRNEELGIEGKLGNWSNIQQNEIIPNSPSNPHSKFQNPNSKVLGITGTGGAGKSSVTDEFLRRFLASTQYETVAVISVDPSRKKTGGALLGDRIRMNAIHHPRTYMRSMATRENDRSLSAFVKDAISVCKNAGFDLIVLESAGVGQSDASILEFCDFSLYVMTPEYGAASQLEKINMLDYADIIAINKFDKAGALDALLEVGKQFKRNHNLWDAKIDELPVVGTIASQFNDAGMNHLFQLLMNKLNLSSGIGKHNSKLSSLIIPPSRVRYLGELSETVRKYNQLVKDQSVIASNLYKITGTLDLMKDYPEAKKALQEKLDALYSKLDPVSRKLINNWPQKKMAYNQPDFEYPVRDKIIKQPMFFTSLSGTKIPKVILPTYNDWGDILRWVAQENAPGHFPFTAGTFPLKREGEDPTRMFAGEGSPERTNKRFHYVALDQPAKRLSTAFDSVTLYGEDPAIRPDILGKVGNSGVSIATVDDAKKLYSGFDLCNPQTSVSMTINGPAPIVLAFFLQAAIDQQCEKWITDNRKWDEVHLSIQQKFKDNVRPIYVSEDGLPDGNNGLGLKLLGISGEELLPQEVYRQIKTKALASVRGTVQADILKEDQAQNTCIFSTEFALKMMGDVQEYFIENQVKNFYSVSISGYHIAEAGANPITQLAFTLSNGFTYIEYYLSRGMKIDDFAPNLSFFFSNGMDPEYSVIGRVARRIWAKTMKYYYKANKRSQLLKYHIQTSGRSLHAQEIDFNDIRTTLQALYAIYDNCNSLHTNAYDEAITTPTEDSVRRAMAIQLIINKELGTAKNENPLQGSFLIEELTDLVEEAVMKEFDKLTDRGGVLGAMERMYQRNKIQEESLHYETMKHNGELPVIGVNTFLNKKGSPTILPNEIIRSTAKEQQQQITNLEEFKQLNKMKSAESLKALQLVAVKNGNVFEALMETVKYCSLGEITHALYEVGGQYRRNM
ncbi:MAG: methylmalonyl-CoA mutase family protein [Chitinophagaceae bacterium]|nr:methylmalonyl-CoA mutase family protein [Chitinophagaceae bacterium]